MPGEQGLLDQFLNDLQPKVIGQLVQAVFEKMKLAGEAGSLLKIEEEIADEVGDAKRSGFQAQSPSKVFYFADLARPQQRELDFDFSGITDEAFWEKAEDRIYAALQSYAEQAENGRGYQRRLFADDAARGFAFIDLCRKRYDVVLMNPPFGEAATSTDRYLRRTYPLGYIDLYTAFLDRASQLNGLTGLTGAITSRTALTLASFSGWRKVRLLGSTKIGVWPILAMVSWTARWLRPQPTR